MLQFRGNFTILEGGHAEYTPDLEDKSSKRYKLLSKNVKSLVRTILILILILMLTLFRRRYRFSRRKAQS